MFLLFQGKKQSALVLSSPDAVQKGIREQVHLMQRDAGMAGPPKKKHAKHDISAESFDPEEECQTRRQIVNQTYDQGTRRAVFDVHVCDGKLSKQTLDSHIVVKSVCLLHSTVWLLKR